MRELKSLNYIEDNSLISRRKKIIDVFRRPKQITEKRPRNIYQNYKKYFLQNRIYYNLSELLIFLKIAFGIDYENFLLRDEIKQEFKAKTNEFLSDYTRYYILKLEYIISHLY